MAITLDERKIFEQYITIASSKLNNLREQKLDLEKRTISINQLIVEAQGELLALEKQLKPLIVAFDAVKMIIK